MRAVLGISGRKALIRSSSAVTGTFLTRQHPAGGLHAIAYGISWPHADERATPPHRRVTTRSRGDMAASHFNPGGDRPTARAAVAYRDAWAPWWRAAIGEHLRGRKWTM